MLRACLVIHSLLALFGALACGADDADLVDIARRRAAVAFGELDPGHPSVGLVGTGGGSCTGTLIGRSTVLTAGHCIPESGAAPAFTLTGSANERYEGKSAVVHPQINLDVPNFSDYDIAVVHLAQRVSGVKPAQLTWSAPQNGMTVTLVGYGIPGDSGLPGSKRTGLARISQVTPLVFYHSRDPARPTTCSGDSGGPIFVDEGGEERLMGVHSGGTVPCDGGAGYGVHVRVDAHRAFIEQQAGADLYSGGPIDVTPPDVSITSPAASDSPPPSFTLEVEASDADSGVARVELWIGDVKKDELSAAPYRFELSGLERRCYQLEVRAVDNEDNVARAEREICIASGEAFGAACQRGDSCKSGLCVDGSCSQACAASEPNPCPDGFACQQSQCVARDGGGGCQLAARRARGVGGASGSLGARGALPTLLFLLLLSALGATRARLRSARRKRRPR